jgi:DNA invertase Pin-like site-specific DNA recombinase
VGVFADAAISGAAGISAGERPQLAQALAMLERGEADQLLAESTDRITRHQGDSFALRERLDYVGARLFTLNDGEVDNFKGTVKGLIDAQFRTELASKTRRGQRGAVADGRAPAGIAYGYRQANRIDENGRPVRGLRAIDQDQAAIVIRIFTEYAADVSPKAIAEGPGPHSRAARRIVDGADDRRRSQAPERHPPEPALYRADDRRAHQQARRPADPALSHPCARGKDLVRAGGAAPAHRRSASVGPRPGGRSARATPTSTAGPSTCSRAWYSAASAAAA